MDDTNRMILTISYLVNMKNDLSCNCNELLHYEHLFNDLNELKNFVKNECNFYLMEKQNDELYLYFIPVRSVYTYIYIYI